MTWKTTTFERAALYQAVWKEPVRTVAKQYGLSDVGLRKICRKLGVPVPPLGYWAKVAARQYPRIIPLPPNHKGQTAYLRRFRIDERAGERASRTKALLASIAPAAAPLSPLKDALEELHPLVRRTGARMGPRSRLANGLLESRGHDVLAMQTSEAEKERALRIADAVLTAALTSGAQLVKGAKDGQRVHLKILGEVVEIRLEEHVRHTLREPTAAEHARKLKEPWYEPDLRVYSPAGKLKLSLWGQSKYGPLLTASDGVTKPLEQRLNDILPRLWTKLAELRVEADLRAEEHDRWRKALARREALEIARKQELERLKKSEEFAERWRRAVALRSYADALERAGKGQTAGCTSESVQSELAWLRNAADWLDPLTSKHWPAVDDVMQPSVGYVTP